MKITCSQIENYVHYVMGKPATLLLLWSWVCFYYKNKGHWYDSSFIVRLTIGKILEMLKALIERNKIPSPVKRMILCAITEQKNQYPKKEGWLCWLHKDVCKSWILSRKKHLLKTYTSPLHSLLFHIRYRIPSSFVWCSFLIKES